CNIERLVGLRLWLRLFRGGRGLEIAHGWFVSSTRFNGFELIGVRWLLREDGRRQRLHNAVVHGPGGDGPGGVERTPGEGRLRGFLFIMGERTRFHDVS